MQNRQGKFVNQSQLWLFYHFLCLTFFLFRFFIENDFLSYQKCQQIHPKKEVLSNSWTSSENFFIKHLFQCKHASKTIEIKIKTRKFPYLISSRLELCDSLFNFIIHFLSDFSNSSLFFFCFDRTTQLTHSRWDTFLFAEKCFVNKR